MNSPYNLSIEVSQTVSLPTIKKIADQIINLNDLSLLNKSRKAYSELDLSIYQWHMKLVNLISQEDIKEKIVTVKSGKEEIVSADTGLDKKNQFKAKIKLEAITHEDVSNQLIIKDILSRLTLKDARTLSSYKQVKLDEKILVGEQDPLIPSKISPGVLPGDPLMASLCLKLLLFFSLVYFYAYTCEATLSKGFTANGTIYGAFSRSIFTQNIFRIGLWLPFIMSLLLALISKEIILWIACFIVGLTIFLIDRKLHSKRFWKLHSKRFLSCI